MVEDNQRDEEVNAATKTRAYWYRHYLEYQTSGLKKVAYSNKHGLVYHQFIYWCRKFAEEPNNVTIKKAGFMPIKLEVNKPSQPSVLCALEFGNEQRLLIYDELLVKSLLTWLDK